LEGKIIIIKKVSGIREGWDPCLQTLEGHSSWVHAVAFSPDATTRTWKQTLEGHSGSVYAVAFSPDGKVLASGSHDATVRLWYATTGAWKQTLEGHGNLVLAVAFSPDGKVLASASSDSTVRLWDATSAPGNRHSKATYIRSML
jgi:WD40 repeat protein